MPGTENMGEKGKGGVCLWLCSTHRCFDTVGREGCYGGAAWPGPPPMWLVAYEMTRTLFFCLSAHPLGIFLW